ncbi:unnamed protein product [Spirodela intermedia]|uniref:Uncharacterized protein n=2 Tax=Spirodela intermedia TaxID=51605 RepID=A0A7I8KB35_SPIIN|nr:unnamed protein product [Spirodela intermedia]CAA6658299.1 unnamed protein product [Spirodela intermedia]CAA7394496.1 unnamed protein product [Spirodela intermedia]
MPAAQGFCVLLILLGLIVFFLWLVLRPLEPTYTVIEFSVNGGAANPNATTLRLHTVNEAASHYVGEQREAAAAVTKVREQVWLWRSGGCGVDLEAVAIEGGVDGRYKKKGKLHRVYRRWRLRF